MQTKPLWEETRDLHHACEAHAVGGAMSTGNPPPLWYASWLQALHQIHLAIDSGVPDNVRRVERIEEDLVALNIGIEPFDAAKEYIKTLDNEKSLAGAIYVLTGAHLMGGEIMRRRLEGFPTKHLEWDDRKSSLAFLQTYRIRDDITLEARACFQALLDIMDEIEARYPLNLIQENTVEEIPNDTIDNISSTTQ